VTTPIRISRNAEYDYSERVEGDDIQWVWTDPAIKPSQYDLKV
jgi:hypothetical protein